MTSAEVVCCKSLSYITDEFKYRSNRVYPNQFNLGPHCLSKRLLKHFSRLEKQTTFVASGALRVKSTSDSFFHYRSKPYESCHSWSNCSGQSDLCPYCLQYRIPKQMRKQITIDRSMIHTRCQNLRQKAQIEFIL